jgi:hypothetical protein
MNQRPRWLTFTTCLLMLITFGSARCAEGPPRDDEDRERRVRDRFLIDLAARQPETLATLKADLARLAVENGMIDLSLRAVREALQGGPPVVPVVITAPVRTAASPSSGQGNPAALDPRDSAGCGAAPGARVDRPGASPLLARQKPSRVCHPLACKREGVG